MKDKLKILFPTGSFYPAQTGGPDNTVYWLTKAMKRKGFSPVISTTDVGQPATTPIGAWLTTDYGEVIYTHNLIHYLPLRVLDKAFSRIKEADILHLSMIFYPASFLSAIVNSWFYGKPMVWSSRGDLDPPMLLRSQTKKKFVRWLINTFVKKELVSFHSTCDAETAYIKHNFGAESKIIQIPNYMELPERVIVPKRKNLLYIGRIDQKKAIENLIQALDDSTIFRESEFTLQIVGGYDSPYGRGLVKQVATAGLKDKVEFLGHRAGHEKEEILSGAWFAIMPSHTENFGIVVLEAMAQGTPAVASLGTPWEILREKDAGYWVDNSPATLRSTVEEIIELPPERMEALQNNAFALARSRFSIHANAEEWTTAYQGVVASAS
ncbi:glycosyltransferase family 4 protein [Neolewinella antarctica]|uniref:Glycosyltransferase involved in cell wall biosynthesis n=1 Tax=Neolewinella antarctica TaxID=442734 RepID=A0ABX0XBK0_9BACT|nr:glycosyltransferase family 4 protein [Neolewinella antarctica]NJC26651.1 glycosyltransferase involved in cell wall biosynthesis [Neolewinella antarctica]